MTPATELTRLLDDGRIDDAIALCERAVLDPDGGSYYAFWLRRLQQRPAPADAAVPGADSPLAAAFAAHPYRFDAAPTVLPFEALQAAKDELVQELPFKGEIYLPTAKIPLTRQVDGLKRVRELVRDHNLQASRQRFEALKRHVRERGVERVFVIGNGPSLKKTDLALLQDEITIGFNGIFLHESFTPTIYVVEDHLVAEDRAAEIRAYRCPVKLFPSYLAYCIDAQPNTIFLNHRGRISYPVDTDFSADAGRITYTGGTVTYTGLQIAASLGVRQIVLIGVDASYKVHDVERSQTYGTGVLTSKSDDTNHFDPRYFGKGYRWHDPNVHTMLQAYRKARNFGRAHGIEIVNASLGGELEVFPRVDYHRLFAHERAYPRVAVIDFTSVRTLSATGIVKRNLLESWSKASLLHVHTDDDGRLMAFQNVANDLYARGSDDNSVWPAFRSLVEFDPDLLYLRPTLGRVPMTVLQIAAAAVLGKPWVVHYMDDWLTKARAVLPAPVADAYHALMHHLFDGAQTVLAISDPMARHLAQVHDVEAQRLQVVHNFMPRIAASRIAVGRNPQRRLVRFFGGIEADMGLATLREFARQVEAINAASPAARVDFEIVTASVYVQRHAQDFAACPSTRLCLQEPEYDRYLEALAGSDLNLLCYNFDERTLGYVRHSLANKLPELLAVDVPFLAIGHPGIATIELLAEHRHPLLLVDPAFRIDDALRRAFEPTEQDLAAWQASRASLRDEFSEERNKYGLYRTLRRSAAEARRGGTPCPTADLARIIHSKDHQLKFARDIDCLRRLPLVDPAVMADALGRIRSHGLDWSVRTEFDVLGKMLPSPEAVRDAAPDLKARALAFLVASLGDDRFKKLNDPVRAWVRSH